tara:strand:+ start:2090 stop:2272 length:183 start_codon:yes stop_codon:yes gene_type:complete
MGIFDATECEKDNACDSPATKKDINTLYKTVWVTVLAANIGLILVLPRILKTHDKIKGGQ